MEHWHLVKLKRQCNIPEQRGQQWDCCLELILPKDIQQWNICQQKYSLMMHVVSHKLFFEANALPYMLFWGKYIVLLYKPEMQLINCSSLFDNCSFDLKAHFNVLTTKLFQQNTWILLWWDLWSILCKLHHISRQEKNCIHWNICLSQ